ncbi:Rv1355c family protein [Dyadobacter psychrotolerans]|uniref:Rv1355c family protein n=1 Tax=Dyadobacter psychrotolerans TaxID=2541721 RepID=A0A4R5E0S5_9BACT|nr:Rv1355c family protein [Dyadobacter psychrotolerans]TDE18171.1 Rv1355c family protein [Dyadobacter psychrotolerans]
MYLKEELNTIYLPIIVKRNQENGIQEIEEILNHNTGIAVLDLFTSQKKELFKIRNPKTKLSHEQTDKLFKEWETDKILEDEGLWVYYPWSNRLIHILDKEEFIELRTNRNLYRISPIEQSNLFNKKIGIIGLSVGHAVALSIATERLCGKLKLADFDTIELSNLNRLKTGLHNIGLNKCVVTAREIAEIDPFIEIECYQKGINNENLSSFLIEGGKLDILIDECDDLEIKIASRVMAKDLKIPVLMETSDRGMLDVERFDLEPERPVLHGILSNMPLDKFQNISEQDRLPLVLKMVNAVNGSRRGKVSLLEIGQTISTWPQLASAVAMGGGVVADVSRRILLNQFTESGRYYVDLEDIVANKKADPNSIVDEEILSQNPYQPFDLNEAIRIADSLVPADGYYAPEDQIIEEIVKAACQAPSTGNDQPWKWLYRNHRLHLFHDRYRSFSFGDFDQIASNLSFGAAVENVILKSNELGLKVKSSLFPLGTESILIAAIDFFNSNKNVVSEPVFSPWSVKFIYDRTTNRNPSYPAEVSETELNSLKEAAESVDGALFHYISDRQQMLALGKIIGECDRIRLLNANGHRDFVEREMKWTGDEAEKSRDGIDIRTLGMNSSQMAALSIIRDSEISKALKSIDGGTALIDVTMKTISTASGLGIVTLPEYSYQNFFLGGMSLQRLWLKAEELQFAVHPLISPFYLFPRVTNGNGAGLDQKEVSHLTTLRKKFLDIVPVNENAAGVFLFKIARAAVPEIKSYRLPLGETLFINNQII